MKVSRRKFITLAPLAAGAAMQLRGTAFGQKTERPVSGLLPPTSGASDLALLSWASFYQFINTDFAFGGGYNTTSLKLVDMTDSRPLDRRTKTTGENFILKFQGPYDKVLEEGIYTVEHFRLGTFQLFVTNGGGAKRRQYYIAVINRVLS
jgi:hypothetical protein